MNKGNLIIDGTMILMANLAVNDDYYTNDMEYLGGMMGLIQQVGGFINQFQPRSVYVTFDIDKSKHRLEIYPEYKAGRNKNLAEDLIKRFSCRAIHTSYLKVLLPMLGVNVLTCPDVEADDIIANFVRQSKRFNTIISTDKDFIQLVGPTTQLYRPIKNSIMITNDNINDVLGYDRNLYLDVRTLEGDKSDNIIGVGGVGEKTALKIFELAGSNDIQIIRNWAEEECKFKYKDDLIEFIDTGKWNFNLRLMDLARGPELNIADLITKPEFDYDKAIEFLNELKVDDFLLENEIHDSLYPYEDLK